jgi:hypothetical protein
MSRKITVTEKDIEDGEPGQETSCPIALACNRAGMEKVYVTSSTVRYTYHGKRVVKQLPAVAANFVDAFDDFGNVVVKPFSFVIR